MGAFTDCFKVASGGLYITYNKYLKVHLIYLLYTVCICANSVFSV